MSTTELSELAINPTVEVVVYGPNLPEQMANLGTFHVHAKGCSHTGDLVDFDPWTVVVPSRRRVAEILFADIASDYDESERDQVINDNASDVYYADCADSLPYEQDPTPVPVDPFAWLPDNKVTVNPALDMALVDAIKNVALAAYYLMYPVQREAALTTEQRINAYESELGLHFINGPVVLGTHLMLTAVDAGKDVGDAQATVVAIVDAVTEVVLAHHVRG